MRCRFSGFHDGEECADTNFARIMTCDVTTYVITLNMTISSKVRQVGNSSAVILPKEYMARFHLDQGDAVNLVETAEGILITPYDKWS